MSTAKTVMTVLLAMWMSIAIAEDQMITTIILVEGEPQLVEMTTDGEIVETLGSVPSYFTSEMQHDDIVERSVARYDADTETRESNIRFVTFEAEETILAEELVDYVREMAVEMDSDPYSSLLITMAIQPSSVNLIEARAESIKDLFVSFGADVDRIVLRRRKYRGTEPNQFMKLELQPSL